MGRTWGRLYSGTRNHPKIRALRRKHPKYWKAIYPLMEMSFEADAEGNIQIAPGEPYSMKDLAEEVDEKVTNLIKLLQDMVSFGLISLQNDIPKFLSYNERQFNSDSDGALRTRKWRAKQPVTVTTEKHFSDVSVTDQNRTEQNRTDIEQKKRNKKEKSSKPEKNILPKDFGISDAVRKWAQEKGFNHLELHLEAFKDIALSRGYEYVDWDRAFMRAIRENWGKINPNGPDGPQNMPKSMKGLRDYAGRNKP